MAKKNTTETGSHVGAAPARENKQKRSRRAEEREARRQAKEQARIAAGAGEAAAEESRPAKATGRRKGKKTQAPLTKGQRIWRRVKIALITLMALVILAGAAATYLGYRITESDRNLPNVYLDGIAVGGMNAEETLATLNENGWDEAAATPLTVTLPLEIRFTLDRREAGVALTAETAARAAYRYGHSDNWFDNLLRYGQNYLNRVDVALDFPLLNEDYIAAQVSEGLKAFARATEATEEELTVDLENARLLTVKGAGQAEISEKKLTEAVKDALLAGETAMSYDHIDSELTMPDYDAAFMELAVEPEDAYFMDDGSFEVVDEVVGCSFDVDEAEKLWREAGLMETVEVPLTITEPEVTGESLRSLLYRDILGAQTTSLSGSSENRINNVQLAVSKINGLILLPGETFSYNGTVGQRTREAGFLEAPAYANGEVTSELGGGICQVSSTLYCAMLYANLETVARTNHQFRVSYLPIAYDATVSWPSPDFQFRNNREYPVKIVAWVDRDANTVTVELHGTNVDGSYVELSNHQYVVYDSTYTNVVVGWGGQAVRHVYDADGNLIEEIKEPYGIYNKHAEDIEWPPEALAAQNETVPVSGDAPAETPPEAEIPATIIDG